MDTGKLLSRGRVLTLLLAFGCDSSNGDQSSAQDGGSPAASTSELDDTMTSADDLGGTNDTADEPAADDESLSSGEADEGSGDDTETEDGIEPDDDSPSTGSSDEATEPGSDSASSEVDPGTDETTADDADSSDDEDGTGGSPGASQSVDGGTADPDEPDTSCGAFSTFDEGLSPTREVFVDVSAAGPGDGSPDDPFPTLDQGFAELAPGTALRIRPGTYPGGAFVSTAHGTAEQPIWIGGVPGEARPIVSGGSNAFQFSPASYLVVHDLELRDQTNNGLNVDDGEVASGDSHHLVFRNLLIHELGDGGNQDCLKLSGVSDHFVVDNEFRSCSAGSAVDHVGCHRGVIARNSFIDLGGNGVQSKGGSDDILITQNRFLDAGERAVNMGGSTGFEFFRPALSSENVNFEARDVRVVANLFRGGTSPIAFVGCVDCLAAHNTLIDPDRWVVRILQETTSTDDYQFAPASGGRFVNNLIYYSREALSTHVNVGPDTAPESFEFANNLWYAHDDPAASEPDSLPVAESAGIYGEDPQLFDPSADDVNIPRGSPAAGAGAALDGSLGDLDATCYEQAPSIGALEVK